MDAVALDWLVDTVSTWAVGTPETTEGAVGGPGTEVDGATGAAGAADEVGPCLGGRGGMGNGFAFFLKPP